jgi:NADH-quinone oxidoreductase subunit E
MAVFEGRTAQEAEAIVARYPAAHARSAVMPLLYLAQSVEGMVTREALREIGEVLGITTAEVEAVATFYTMYRLRPTGTHLVNVCTNLACKLRGAEAVYEAAYEAAGIEPGAEVSPDQIVTVHEEECLGVCDFAPAVQIDLANHDNVTPERVRELIAQLRSGQVPEPARGPAVASFRAASRMLAGLTPDDEPGLAPDDEPGLTPDDEAGLEPEEVPA